MADASSSSSLRPTASAAVGAATLLIGDPLMGRSVAELLGQPNLLATGTRMVEPAQHEGRLFQLAGPDSVPLGMQARAYMQAYQARYGVPYPCAAEGLTKRLQALQRDLATDVELPVWIILDEVELPVLARAGGIASIADRALGAYSIRNRSVYISSVALLEQLVRQGPDGKIALDRLLVRSLQGVREALYLEPSHDDLTSVNDQIARARRVLQAGWNEETTQRLIAQRMAVVRQEADAPATVSTGDLGKNFPGGVVPEAVVRAIQARLGELEKTGHVTFTLERLPASGGIRVHVSYPRSLRAWGVRAIQELDAALTTATTETSSSGPCTFTS